MSQEQNLDFLWTFRLKLEFSWCTIPWPWKKSVFPWPWQPCLSHLGFPQMISLKWSDLCYVSVPEKQLAHVLLQLLLQIHGIWQLGWKILSQETGNFVPGKQQYYYYYWPKEGNLMMWSEMYWWVKSLQLTIIIIDSQLGCIHAKVTKNGRIVVVAQGDSSKWFSFSRD